jgi:hypothetical protein
MSLRQVRPVRLSSVVRTTFAVTSLTLSLAATAQQRPDSRQSQSAVQVPAVAKYGELPLAFEANQGQTDAGVRFLARGYGYSLYLTDSEAVLALHKPSNCPLPKMRVEAKTGSCTGKTGTKPDVVRMKLAGVAATLSAKTTGEDELPGKVNYFFGNDPAKWHTNLPTYKKVRYAGVYPGVDLIYYGNQRKLEHDFVVAPGADPARIRLALDGAKQTRIDPTTGDLILSTGKGELRLLKPITYQESNGQRTPVSSNYKLLAKNQVAFQVARYNHAQPLVIDPVLVYSTYLGGCGTSCSPGSNSGDQAFGISVDSAGSAYVAGATSSLDFPVTAGAFQTTNKVAKAGHGSTAFVSKFNADGSALVYSTFLGGSGNDSVQRYNLGEVAYSIALDSSGNAYVTGSTESEDFPVTPGAFQTVNKSAPSGQTSAFVTKLNAAGDSLVYSTFLGGTPQPEEYIPAQSGFSIVVDQQGDAYVGGTTSAADFPTTANAFQTTFGASSTGGMNGFVTKLNPDGTALVFSTYLGGRSSVSSDCPPPGTCSDFNPGDQANAIAIDGHGNVYIAGATSSPNFPVTEGAFQTVLRGSANAFVTELNPDGSSEIFSTYIGGSEIDRAVAIALGGDGNVYIAGSTDSGDFPITPGVFITTPPSGWNPSGFVTKLNPDGSALAYSTYFNQGGPPGFLAGLAVDSSGSAYVTGLSAYVEMYPTTPDAVMGDTSPTQSPSGVALVGKLNPDATGLEFSTLVGSPAGGLVGHWSAGNALALDSAGNLYLAGFEAGNDFPATPGAFQSTNPNKIAGWPNGFNAFVAKLALAGHNASHFITSLVLSGPTGTFKTGDSLTFTVKVTGTTGHGTPTGTVGIYAGTSSYMATLDASGSATWTTTTLAPGDDSPGAYYLGDSSYLTSSGSGPSFSVIGGPALMIGYAVCGTSTVYGRSICGLDIVVTDSAGHELAGVPVTFSGEGLSFSPAATQLTGQGGDTEADFSAHPLRVGNLTAYATSPGVPKPLIYHLTATPARLRVTVLQPKERLYGSPNPQFSAALKGLVNGDTVGGTILLDFSTPATVSSPVGSYPVTATVSGTAASDYNAEVEGSTLTVRRAQLLLAAVGYSTIYGQTPPPPTRYTLTGFVNGDTESVVSGAPILSTNVTAKTPVGSFYPIAISRGTLSAENYGFARRYTGGIAVERALLTVIANNLTMTQGGAVPPLTYTMTGFVNGDTASVVAGAPVLSTTATASSPPGQYPITVKHGTLSAENYKFSEVDGWITIVK